jgi:hypothetical protein
MTPSAIAAVLRETAGFLECFDGKITGPDAEANQKIDHIRASLQKRCLTAAKSLSHSRLNAVFIPMEALDLIDKLIILALDLVAPDGTLLDRRYQLTTQARQFLRGQRDILIAQAEAQQQSPAIEPAPEPKPSREPVPEWAMEIIQERMFRAEPRHLPDWRRLLKELERPHR